jgi:hypothetical protein
MNKNRLFEKVLKESNGDTIDLGSFDSLEEAQHEVELHAVDMFIYDPENWSKVDMGPGVDDWQYWIDDGFYEITDGKNGQFYLEFVEDKPEEDDDDDYDLDDDFNF